MTRRGRLRIVHDAISRIRSMNDKDSALERVLGSSWLASEVHHISGTALTVSNDSMRLGGR